MNAIEQNWPALPLEEWESTYRRSTCGPRLWEKSVSG